MAKVKKPILQTGDLYHLCDLIDATISQSNHRLLVKLRGGNEKRTLSVKNFPIDVTPKYIDGVACNDYAALNMHIGGDLHVYILVIASNSIWNFTLLWISSKSPTEPLQSAFRTTGEPLPLLDLLTLLHGNTKQGFFTDDRKQWRELPEASHLDLLKRGSVDADFRAGLKI